MIDTALGRPCTFRFRSISQNVLVFKFYTRTSRGSSCAFWFRAMTYLDVLTHTSFPEQISKTTGPITVILQIPDL